MMGSEQRKTQSLTGDYDHNHEREKTMQFINDYTHVQIMKTETELKENAVHGRQGNTAKTMTASLKKIFSAICSTRRLSGMKSFRAYPVYTGIPCCGIRF